MMTKASYVQVRIRVQGPLQEGVMALLAPIGYEAFEQEAQHLLAYIPTHLFNIQSLEEQIGIIGLGQVDYTHEELPARNWNAEWEAGFTPIYIGNFCQIVPVFHEAKEGYTHTLYISPEMAFGTGYHATTQLMIMSMESCQFEGKKVLDMGCGTGILGMLAAKMGAEEVVAIDIDMWSYENTIKNAEYNGIRSFIEVKVGDVSAIPSTTFDLILANINRGVLLADVPTYVEHLRPGGYLLLSGCLTEDEAVLDNAFQDLPINKLGKRLKNNWIALMYHKK